MECPLCKVTLQMTDRQGVEIDYCPTCRGIWLDRGELEKLIDLSSMRTASSTPALSHSDRRGRTDDERHHDNDQFYDRRNDSDYRNRIPKKKESWLGELFDFG